MKKSQPPVGRGGSMWRQRGGQVMVPYLLRCDMRGAPPFPRHRLVVRQRVKVVQARMAEIFFINRWQIRISIKTVRIIIDFNDFTDNAQMVILQCHDWRTELAVCVASAV